jgi:Heme/copper-type cytochrome/quinol oxidase, subunit 3
MTFAGLTSGYVVSRSALKADSAWLSFPLPQAFTVATVLIALSSVTMIFAQRSARLGALENITRALALTLLLGLGFVVSQLLGWQNLLDRGLYFTGPESNTAISWVYVITFLHALHVLAGLIVLIFTLVKAVRKKYTADDYQGLSVAAIFWHFLGGLWLYLFLFLLFIR